VKCDFFFFIIQFIHTGTIFFFPNSCTSLAFLEGKLFFWPLYATFIHSIDRWNHAQYDQGYLFTKQMVPFLFNVVFKVIRNQ